MNKKENISTVKILEEANNLKRTKDSMAKELKLPIQLMKKVLSGKASTSDTSKVIKKMLETYPIKESDLHAVKKEDFSPFVICSQKLSKKSTRFFKRKNGLGLLKNYYEYRDTAMSKNSPIYPEWIKPLAVVNNKNPKNKLVCYNKGHILHQFTFFIGKVNFYWKDDKGFHCKEMNTGDSNYIPPYISHSFTSRDKDNLGLIIAVTFGDILKFSKEKFLYYNKSDLESFIGKQNKKNSHLQALIHNFINKKFLDMKSFETLLIQEGFTKNQTKNLIKGIKLPSNEQTLVLSKLLGLPYHFLESAVSNKTAKVIINKFKEDRFRTLNNGKSTFKILDLARSSYKKELNSFLMEVNTYSKSYNIRHELNEYVYNFSNEVIYLKVKGKIELLQPGESAIFSPLVEHSFYTKKHSEKLLLLIVRVPDDFSDNFFSMYAGLSDSSKRKAFSETTQWF